MKAILAGQPVSVLHCNQQKSLPKISDSNSLGNYTKTKLVLSSVSDNWTSHIAIDLKTPPCKKKKNPEN